MKRKYIICAALCVIGLILLVSSFRSILPTTSGYDRSRSAADYRESTFSRSGEDQTHKQNKESGSVARNYDPRLDELTRAQLFESARRFPIKDFPEYIDFIVNSNLDGNIKRHLVSIAARRMSGEGHLAFAKQILIGNLSDIVLRESALSALYGGSGKPYDYLSKSISELNAESDRKAASLGLLEWARRADPSEIFISLGKVAPEDQHHIQYFMEGLSGQIVLAQSRSEREIKFKKIFRMLSDAGSHLLGDKYLKQYLSRTSSVMPFESWAAWQGKFKSMPSGKYQSQMLIAMHGTNVEHTLSAVMKDWPADSKNPHAVNNFLRKAVETGMKQDSAQVMKWYEANKATLSPTVSDGISEPIAKRLTMEKKFDEAQKWVGQLSNEGLKDRSIRGMAQFRAAEVKEQIKADPQATVEALQSENHLESPILIGVAVNEWLNKDPDEAGKWFFDNSKNMGAAERDYSAEAFVKYGIKVGDLDAARQWADQHSSEEKRSQYLKQIDHAAVEKKHKKKE